LFELHRDLAARRARQRRRGLGRSGLRHARFGRSGRLFLIAAVLLPLAACAKYQRINVLSEPNGAQVFVDGTLVGKTPVKLVIERTKDHIVFLKLDGYVPVQEVLVLNRASDRIDFLTPADVELRMARRLEADDPTRDAKRGVNVELEKEDSTP